jgi:hypothetical protein
VELIQRVNAQENRCRQRTVSTKIALPGVDFRFFASAGKSGILHNIDFYGRMPNLRTYRTTRQLRSCPL